MISAPLRASWTRTTNSWKRKQKNGVRKIHIPQFQFPFYRKSIFRSVSRCWPFDKSLSVQEAQKIYGPKLKSPLTNAQRESVREKMTTRCYWKQPSLVHAGLPYSASSSSSSSSATSLIPIRPFFLSSFLFYTPFYTCNPTYSSYKISLREVPCLNS